MKVGAVCSWHGTDWNIDGAPNTCVGWVGPNWVDIGCQPRLEDREPGSAWASSQVPAWQGQGPAACLVLLQASEDCVSAAEGQALTAWTVRGLRTRQEGRGKPLLTPPTGFSGWLATLATMVRATVALLSQEAPE